MTEQNKKVNDENATCNRCHRSTQPLFHTGRKMWCPVCEGFKPSAPPKEKPPKPQNSDTEITTPLDWGDWGII